MTNKIRREFYLLSRGEQRALLAVTFLLILSLAARLVLHYLPGREPSGIKEFEEEARTIMAMIATADSLDQAAVDSSNTWRSESYKNTRTYRTTRVQERSHAKIDLNRADSIQLLPLPGIGPVFAGRIVKYRKLLGGFVSASQLEEVYGMPPETVKRIKGRIHIDTSAIQKIKLDSATFSELLRHPYLDYEQVKAMVEYREYKGKISSLSELCENHILSDSSAKKLAGYFQLW